MKKSYFSLIIIIFLINSVTIGQPIKITGKLYDRESGKTISGGVIFLNPGNQVSTTTAEGDYSFTSSPGKKQLTARTLGYKPAFKRFNAFSDTIIDIHIEVSPIELGEVSIVSDSLKNMEITPMGSFILTPGALRETPRLFSEPDLLKSFQMMPGVVAGKDGSSEIYIRGGGTGQNVVLASGCYFFLPGHLLGIISPYDLDFLEGAELYKDYFPAEIGGGASSVIDLDFKKPQSDSLGIQLRLGLLSSGVTIDLPLKKIKWDLTAGLKRGNYSIFAPLLKRIVSSDVDAFLPPDNYSFYDGFVRLSHSSQKWGDISYLFFGNYDNGKNETITKSHSADTLINYTDGISTGWNSMVNAIEWKPLVKNILKWKVSLNYNRLSMGRIIYMNTEKFLNETDQFYSRKIAYSFSPTINSLGSTIIAEHDDSKFSYSAGISARLRSFDPNTIATDIDNDAITRNNFGQSTLIFEPGAFVSSTMLLAEKLQLDAGIRLSAGMSDDRSFVVAEPRLRFSFDPSGIISPHINYVRLSQFDHSVEGSNAGLRTMLWLPVSKGYGPEVSNVLSAGFRGMINNDINWSVDGYYKRTIGMLDFKPGASFIFDTSFVDILDRIEGRAYGLEMGIIKRKGKLTGSMSYTYSRSKREWGSPEGHIWIPSNADRPHNLYLAAKYYFKTGTSFGLSWVYQSGSPATIYMHETSYGEFFETKNNIRYFDYHRLDISVRQIIHKKRFSIFIDADVYNVYNHKNTFYFKKTFDIAEMVYYFKNISLLPIIPSITLSIKF